MPSDTPAKAGPILPDSVAEVQAAFPSEAALQDALTRLTAAGFDRAQISLPAATATARQDTPEQGAENPTTDADQRQMRTLQTSMAGSIGAIAAAGAVIATGGAALVGLAAAAAVGAGTGLAAHTASRAGDSAGHQDRAEAAAAGTLVLAVRTPTPQNRADAEAIMRTAGATRIVPVDRVGGASPAQAGISTGAWTGM